MVLIGFSVMKDYLEDKSRFQAQEDEFEEKLREEKERWLKEIEKVKKHSQAQLSQSSRQGGKEVEA